MDKDQPYGELHQKMNDLPLPDQDAAWINMQQKLDNDKRRRRTVLPVIFRSCTGWGLLFLVLAIAAWFMIKPMNWLVKDDPIDKEKAIFQEPFPVDTEQKSLPGQTDEKGKMDKPFLNLQTPDDLIGTEEKLEKKRSESLTGIIKTKNTLLTNGARSDKKEITHHQVRQETTTDNEKQQIKEQHISPISALLSDTIQQRSKQVDSLVNKKLPDSMVVQRSTDADSAMITLKTADKTDTLAVADNKKSKHQKKKSFQFSAGLGMQQQIPFSGQTAVPYNYYGRKSSLSDYIPSVYLKAEKENKWFLMGEFRFGAPQSLKEFSYNRQTKFDTMSNNITTTTLRLKKTYYHQLPLSFNYYVVPGWSVGVGGIYSRFHGAITEKEIRHLNIQTQAETVTKNISRIQHFTDSFLYKTQVHMLFQTQYQWKRFLIGLRYTKDVQPYIRYTKPDGRINEEKNQTIQLTLKYSLWKKKTWG